MSGLAEERAPLPAPPEPATAAARWTVLDVIKWTMARFTERRLDTPRLDAEILVAHALGLSRVQLYVQFDRPLLPDELAAIRALIKRRQAGESVAYVVGKKEFWGLELAVDARVLVPRPDTESLVEEGRARLDEAAHPDERIGDVGTGSGAVALALAKVRPAAAVFAGDLSADALAVARGNAERLGLAVTFVEGDLAAPLAAHAPFSLLVANLPYIPTGELAGLPPEVRAEPARALDGGPDGLDLVRRLIAEAPPLLRAGGALALEIGFGQAAATADLLAAGGFTDVRSRRDLAGIDRVVSGVKA
ncbi:MAG TPA: peptide chain release factor N(5)-glutamine methyltransferase [Polyangia bacterium]|nr:peptide chain release factor N(5)-glutamine methyltransferase [Polyangia bacterium]